MMSLTPHHQYYFYGSSVDFRKGFQGLSGLVQNELGCNPMDGSVYVFSNRRHNKLKLLLWESGGFVLFYKSLEQGTFDWPKTEGNSKTIRLNWERLSYIVRGVRIEKISQKKRYIRP